LPSILLHRVAKSEEASAALGCIVDIKIWELIVFVEYLFATLPNINIT
jgi:hypothetical protein